MKGSLAQAGLPFFFWDPLVGLTAGLCGRKAKPKARPRPVHKPVRTGLWHSSSLFVILGIALNPLLPQPLLPQLDRGSPFYLREYPSGHGLVAYWIAVALMPTSPPVMRDPHLLLWDRYLHPACYWEGKNVQAHTRLSLAGNRSGVEAVVMSSNLIRGTARSFYVLLLFGTLAQGVCQFSNTTKGGSPPSARRSADALQQGSEASAAHPVSVRTAPKTGQFSADSVTTTFTDDYLHGRYNS